MSWNRCCCTVSRCKRTRHVLYFMPYTTVAKPLVAFFFMFTLKCVQHSHTYQISSMFTLIRSVEASCLWEYDREQGALLCDDFKVGWSLRKETMDVILCADINEMLSASALTVFWTCGVFPLPMSNDCFCHSFITVIMRCLLTLLKAVVAASTLSNSHSKVLKW